MKLGPRYHVVDEIARGGMGVVMLALRTSPGGGATPVAIKQLHAHLVDNADVVTSFVDEARIASRIVHPNVVPVLDVEMIKDQLVIVMDYVEGVPLRDLIRKREGSLPIPVVRRIMVDALNGLHAAHELADEQGAPLGVVHRDVSPHNLLVGTNGVTKVTDFGIAMAAGRIASTKPDGAVKGKLQYLSPEQVFRKGIDRRTDVFAAGLVAWEALVGRKLFDAGTEGETLAMIIREPIQPPSAHRIEVPLDLDEAVLRALERDADRRWDSAYAFARALEEGGPLATREEVERIVVEVAGENLAARRERLSNAKVAGPQPLEEEDAPTRVVGPTAAPTVVVPRPAPKASSVSPIVLLVVGSFCVSGGLIAGATVRSRPAAPASDPTTTLAPIGTTEPEPSATAPASTTTPAYVPPAPTVVVTTPVTIPAPTATPKAAHRAHASGGTRKADAGHGGRPFMPDDL